MPLRRLGFGVILGAIFPIFLIGVLLEKILETAARPPKTRKRRQRERCVRRDAAQQETVTCNVDEHTIIEGFSPTLPTELWCKIMELATFVPGTLPTNETHSPNMLTPYHTSSTYDDDTRVQAKLRKSLRMKRQLLFVCKDWLNPSLLNLYREVYIGSSHALVSLADSLNATGEFDPYSDANIGRSVLRLDVAMRDKAPDNDVVTSALLKVLDRVPGLQILVIRRQFGSFYSSIYQGDDGWDINVHKRILPRQVAVALVSPRLPNLRVVSSFYPFTFVSTENGREIALVGRIYVVPLKIDLGIFKEDSSSDRIILQNLYSTVHLSIVDYSEKSVPRILTSKEIQRRGLSSIELTDVFGECSWRFQQRDDARFRIPTLLDYIAEHLPTVQNIDLVFPRYANNIRHHYDSRPPAETTKPYYYYPFKTLGLRIPPSYRKGDVSTVLFLIVSHILSRSPFMESIRILDRSTLQTLVNNKKTRRLMRIYPHIRMEDRRGKQLVFPSNATQVL